MDGFEIGIYTILIVAALYLLPTLIAFNRRHHKRIGILFLNVVLGWTFIIWVALLFYAILSKANGNPLDGFE